MYPRLFEIPLPFEIFGAETLTIYSFGAMVALAALAAGWLAQRELDRMYRAGRVGSIRVPVDDERGRRRTRKASPAAMVWNLTVLAVAVGLVGAKIFHALENPTEFMLDPIGMLFSSGGFTFYGGLILAALTVAWYVRRQGLPVGAVADAAAPGLFLGYGIGRIGCYLAGDGDWGICSTLANKPDWLPTWLWSETFPNSILDAGDQWQMDAVILEQCPTWADGVYPTMLYEFGASVLIFGILWSLRKHPYANGWLFMLYLFFNGVERFFIEKIRVNNEFDLLGITVTQAEVISTLLVLVGLAGVIYLSRTRREDSSPEEEQAAAAGT